MRFLSTMATWVAVAAFCLVMLALNLQWSPMPAPWLTAIALLGGAAFLLSCVFHGRSTT